MTIQLYRGGWARSLVQEWGSKTVWFTHNTHPVGSLDQGTFGNGPSAFSKSHLSPSRAQNSILESQFTSISSFLVFLWEEKNYSHKRTGCYCTTPMREWRTNKKGKALSFAEVTELSLAVDTVMSLCSLTWAIKWLQRGGGPACDYSSSGSGNRCSVWHLLPISSVGMDKPLSLWVNKGRRAGKDGS